MPKEREIVRGILKRLRDAGAFAEKIHGNEYMRIGMPDILASYRGVFLGIEVKQPGKYPTEVQYRVLNEIRAAGGFATWMNNVNQADLLIRDLDERIRTGQSTSSQLRTPRGPFGSSEM